MSALDLAPDPGASSPARRVRSQAALELRTTLRNVRTGAVIDRTFRSAEKVERAIVDKREMQFLYKDSDEYVFMDTETYEQITLPRDLLGDAAAFLKPDVTFQALDAIALKQSDNEAARQLNQARQELFQTINTSRTNAA